MLRFKCVIGIIMYDIYLSGVAVFKCNLFSELVCGCFKTKFVYVRLGRLINCSYFFIVSYRYRDKKKIL